MQGNGHFMGEYFHCCLIYTRMPLIDWIVGWIDRVLNTRAISRGVTVFPAWKDYVWFVHVVTWSVERHSRPSVLGWKGRQKEIILRMVPRGGGTHFVRVIKYCKMRKGIAWNLTGRMVLYSYSEARKPHLCEVGVSLCNGILVSKWRLWPNALTPTWRPLTGTFSPWTSSNLLKARCRFLSVYGTCTQLHAGRHIPADTWCWQWWHFVLFA